MGVHKIHDRRAELFLVQRLHLGPAKCAKNIENHGIDFAVVYDFVFSTALIRTDDRFDYGEVREIALGFIGERLHVLVFTRRAPNLHVISLRKPNERERSFYGTR
jgi:uncharacterized protein